jgi:iron complex outermembrane receptor protein
MNESREGGTLPGRVLPSGTEFRESQHTRRLDGSAVGHWALASGLNFNGRASLTRTTQDHMFDAERVASTQSTVYAEGAWNNQWDGHSWVLGLAFQHSALSAAAAPGVSYAYDVPALFVQDEFSAATWLSFAVSARVDVHNRYGTFQSARLSALLRQPGGEWSLRASVGNGFAAPTAFVEQVEAPGLGALLPLRGLQAERAVTASLDAKWADAGWDLNLSVFTSEIRHPLQVNSIADRLQLANSPGTRRAPGAEALVGYVAGPLHFIASYSYIAASEIAAPGVRQDVPNMPRHSAEIAAILENDKRGRIGLELGYTGRQRLTDNPYRSVSRSYFELSALGEIRFGSVAVFLNAINLTDMRQTHNDPLVRPTLGPGGNPITDVWAPIDGRTFNLGVRVAL